MEVQHVGQGLCAAMDPDELLCLVQKFQILTESHVGDLGKEFTKLGEIHLAQLVYDIADCLAPFFHGSHHLSSCAEICLLTYETKANQGEKPFKYEKEAACGETLGLRGRNRRP